MASLEGAPGVAAQLWLIGRLRWQMFRNGLRTLRGKIDLVSLVLVGLLAGAFVLGAGFGLGTGAYVFVSQGKPELLGLLFGAVFIIWQVMPLFAAASSSPLEFSNLLRFPLRFPAFLLLNLAYGFFEPTSVAALFCLLCIIAGIGLARPEILGPALPPIIAFAALNLLLNRAVFAWLERWLAQRRTRELFFVILFFGSMSLQFLGPLAERGGKRTAPVLLRLAPAAKALPPGLAGEAVAAAARGKGVKNLALSATLTAGALVLGWALALRLRAQYRGEVLSESEAPAKALARARKDRRAVWSLPFSGPVGAVFEKEVRYLRRSASTLMLAIMPLFLLLFFGFSAGARRMGGFFARQPDLLFPIGVAYSLFGLANLVCNNLGSDGYGVQMLLLAPVRFRDVLLGKNLAHALVSFLDAALVWLGVSVFFRPPEAVLDLVTISGLLFALPVDFAAGNLLSLYFPKRIEFAGFRGQRNPGITVLISLGVQILVLGIAASVVVITRLARRLWLAVPAFLVLAAVAIWAYFQILSTCSTIAIGRREALASELCR